MISFDEKQKVFNLTNASISHLFSIEEGGLLGHLYYGPKIRAYHGERFYPRIDRGFSGNLPDSLDRTYSKDDLLQEYSGNNTGDFRLPAIVIKTKNGARMTDFRYQSYKIINGKPKLEGLPQSYVESDQEAQTLEVTLRDDVIKADLVLTYTIYRDRPVITRNARLINCGSEAFQVEKLASMQLDLTKQNYDLVYLPGQYGVERQTRRKSIDQGIFEMSSRRGASSHHMNPFAAIVDKDTDEFHGNVMATLLVYSGNFKISLESDQIDQIRLLVGINDDNFSWKLNPGESFQTPEAINVYSTKGLNGMTQVFHHLLRERVARGKWRDRERPIIINNWEATEMNFDAAKLDQIVEEAEPLGIEMFVLDDGWFGHRDDDNSSLGDWYVNTKKIDLHKVAKQTHDAGMKFGLWFEPEMISKDSDLYKNHPDYVLHEPGRGMTLARNQLVLDFSRPEVVDNIFDQICKILDDVDIDYIKWDCNRNLTEVYSAAYPADQEGEIAHRHILGVYSLMERLIERYPDILFESCSGGGGRDDAGLLYYMPQCWPSDNTDANERLRIQEGTSLVYPISSVTGHVSAVPNGHTNRITSFKMRGDVAMSATFGYELDPSALTEDEKAEVKKQVAFYKEHRKLIQFGDFYRLQSAFAGNHVAWEFVSPDKSEALLFMYRKLSSVRYEIVNTKMYALDPDKNYQDSVTGKIYGGDELMNLGLFRNPTHKGDFISEVHYFKAVK